MEAENLLNEIRKLIEEKYNVQTTITLYNAVKLEKQFAFGILDTNDKGETIQSFRITVEDIKIK